MDIRDVKVGQMPRVVYAPPAAPAIDFTKPVRTKSGKAVEVITTEGRGRFPILVYLDDKVLVEPYTREGKLSFGRESYDDLENIPPEPEYRYMNVYKTGGGAMYMSRQEAEEAYCNQALEFNVKERIGVLKIDITAVGYAE